MDSHKFTPLHIATREQNIFIVKMLIGEFNANLNAVDASLNTSLHYAVMQANLRLVKVLLDGKPRIDIKNINGSTVFNIANNQTIQSVSL